MLQLRRILVPVDFSETSDRALDEAIELASKFGATITVLHAYQIPVYGFPDGAFITGADIASQLSSAAQQRLDALVQARRAKGVELTAVLRSGVPWEEIDAVAKTSGADLIVIGTHGRRGLSRALLGSVAENVIRTTTLPVLTIKGPHEGS